MTEPLKPGTPLPWFAGPVTSDDYDNDIVSIGPYDLLDRPLRQHHYEDTICEVWGAEHDAHQNAAYIVEACNAYPTLTARVAALTAALHQYRSDMLYPPAADSRERRIAMIDKLLTEGTDA